MEYRYVLVMGTALLFSFAMITVITHSAGITIFSPLNISYANNSIEFNITANSTLSWAVVEILGVNHSLTNRLGQWQYFNNTLRDSSYSATFWFNDTSGNVNTTTRYFTVNTPSTVAFLADARPRGVGDGEAQLAVDLNASDNPAVIGNWRLPDAFVFVGDIDYINYTGGQNMLSAIASSDVSSIPAFFAIGNHEIDNVYDMPAARAVFVNYSYSPNPGPSGTRNTTYSFDVGELHIVVLNHYWDGNDDDDCTWSAPAAGDNDDSCCKYNSGDGGFIPQALFEWLKTDLRSSSKTYKLVAGHEPGYPVSRHVGDSLDANTTNRDKFWNLLGTEGVFAHLSGHTHTYSFQEYSGLFEANVGQSGRVASNDATIIYAYAPDVNTFEIRTANENADWSNPTIATFGMTSLSNQTLINTWNAAGTQSRYFIDRVVADESNPDWSSNMNSKWWSPYFDDASASFSDGDLAVGFDNNNPSGWGWINTPISAGSGVHGIFNRLNFTVFGLTSYSSLKLGVDYDDAIAIWINGARAYSSYNTPSVSEGDIWDKYATAVSSALGDESISPTFTMIDITPYLRYVNDGSNNTIAIGNWNSESSNNLVAGVRLLLSKETPPTYPSVFSISPISGSSWTESNQVTFSYNTSATGLTNCSLLVNDDVVETDTSITENTTQTITTTLANGDYSWNIKCTNSNSRTNHSYGRRITVSYSPPGINNGDSGSDTFSNGGAPASDDSSETRIITRIAPYSQGTAEFERAGHAISKILIKPIISVDDVTISVSAENEKPITTIQAHANTYRYINVRVRNIREEDILSARIFFVVNKSWINENNINKDTIKLLRFSDNEWENLSTSLVNENQSSLTYMAITPGFSYFAIIGEKNICLLDGVCDDSIGESSLNCLADCPIDLGDNCIPNERMCNNTYLLQCKRGDVPLWAIKEKCQYGCDSNNLTCISGGDIVADGGPDDSIYYVLGALGILALFFASLVSRRGGKKSIRKNYTDNPYVPGLLSPKNDEFDETIKKIMEIEKKGKDKEKGEKGKKKE